MKRTRLRKFPTYTLGCIVFLLSFGTALANPFEDTIRILENRTAFHWGRDCLVWVVHYSENLVDPWVEAEAGRVGMTDSERSAYRESFVSDLSIGRSEPVLVTVHAFGARPLNFSPFSEKIALVTPSGERVKPTKYDKALDQPLSGVVQGLVFFPKQSDPDFAITIAGLGVYNERVFSFAREGPISGSGQVVETPEEDEVIVVELPPAPAKANPPPKAPARREPQSPQKTQKAAPQRPQEPPEPEKPQIAVLESAVPEPTGPEIVVLEPGKPASDNEDNTQDVAYDSREKTLRAFLELWVKFDPETMYSMLSASSRKLFSRQTFEAELKKASDFRSALRDGYTIDWLGAERAKVVTVKRILLIRTLLSRTLGVTREDAVWKIVW